MTLLALLLGCRPPAPPPPPPPPPPREETLWAARHDAAALQEALEIYAAQQPPSRHALTRLARGHALLADAHADTPEAALAAWEAAMRWGETCLDRNPDWSDARKKMRLSAAQVADTLAAEDAPCAYWSALGMQGWLGGQGSSTRLRHRDTLEARMRRVDALDPGLDHRGPDRFWGRRLATLPPYAGGDLDAARARLDRAVEQAPDYLDNRVEMAATWAVAAGEAGAFDALLDAAEAVDPTTAAPALRAENEAALRQAADLRARRDQLFAE